MKKILFINTLYSPHIGGGAEIILQAQAEGLKEKGYDVIILATKEKGDVTADYVNDIKVYRVGIKNLYWPYKKEKHNPISKLCWHLKDRSNPKMMKYLHHVMNLEKPDLVICHNLTGWSITTWEDVKKFNIPVFQVLHDQYLLCLNSGMYKNDKICEKQCYICNFMRKGFASKTSNVDVVIGVSKFILNKFIDNNYFLPSRKELIYNRLNLDTDRISQKTHNPIRIGYIGSLNKVKGVDLLIKSFKRTKINATLLIAGKGETIYENYLKEIAYEDTRIKFLGYVESKSFYSDIDILIVPSLWDEPLGLIAIEACANSVAVIASKRGGLPEIIKDDINGLLIEPDETSIYNAILYYSKNPTVLSRHKNNGIASVKKFLDFDAMIDEYVELIESYTIK